MLLKPVRPMHFRQRIRFETFRRQSPEVEPGGALEVVLVADHHCAAAVSVHTAELDVHRRLQTMPECFSLTE